MLNTTRKNSKLIQYKGVKKALEFLKPLIEDDSYVLKIRTDIEFDHKLILSSLYDKFNINKDIVITNLYTLNRFKFLIHTDIPDFIIFSKYSFYLKMLDFLIVNELSDQIHTDLALYLLYNAGYPFLKTIKIENYAKNNPHLKTFLLMVFQILGYKNIIFFTAKNEKLVGLFKKELTHSLIWRGDKYNIDEDVNKVFLD